MKKQILALIACLMLVMSTTAQAVTLRAPVARQAFLLAEQLPEEVLFVKLTEIMTVLTLKLTLYEGNIYLDSWSASGNGTVPISGECLVKKGKSYRLVLAWSINGVAQPNQSVTKTCP